jgi:hypothetical protein
MICEVRYFAVVYVGLVDFCYYPRHGLGRSLRGKMYDDIPGSDIQVNSLVYLVVSPFEI